MVMMMVVVVVAVVASHYAQKLGRWELPHGSRGLERTHGSAWSSASLVRTQELLTTGAGVNDVESGTGIEVVCHSGYWAHRPLWFRHGSLYHRHGKQA